MTWAVLKPDVLYTAHRLPVVVSLTLTPLARLSPTGKLSVDVDGLAVFVSLSER